jgi:hypothetical protein
MVAHDRLDGVRHLDVLRIGHSVANDGRLERDDRTAGLHRLANIVSDVNDRFHASSSTPTVLADRAP